MVRATQIEERPRPWKWTLPDYYRAANLGWFDGQRVELIEGELIEMPAQSNGHQMAIGLAQRQLERAFGARYWVRIQLPLVASVSSEPEPDLAVVPGGPRDYAQKPAYADLVIEIADSSLLFDRTKKSHLYAGMNIPEYWIVNLVDRQLEVHRNPIADRLDPKASTYTQAIVYTPGEAVSPVARRRAKIKIDDLLP